MSRTALVAGATGLVGSALLPQLLTRSEYSEIRVLGRRAPPLKSEKLRFLSSDYGQLGTLGTQLAAEDVYCCLGTTVRKAGSHAAFERVDYHMVVDLARAAQKAGARRFIVISAAGASLRSPLFYLRLKARMEQAVADVGFETVHILRPSLLLGRRQEFRPVERLGQLTAPLFASWLVGPLRKYRAVG
ncbi:MAG: NAD(P)H-binding protein, partial [Nevskiales bacterium]|nr:NAD(P)H-binding protein [Nevskiales bacterium]